MVRQSALQQRRLRRRLGDAEGRKLTNTGQNSCSRTQQMRFTQPSTNTSNFLPAGVLRNFERTLYAMKEPRAPPSEPTTGPTYSCHLGDEEEGETGTTAGGGEGLTVGGGGLGVGGGGAGGGGEKKMMVPFRVMKTVGELPAGTVSEPSLAVMTERYTLWPAKRAERAFWKTAPRGFDSRRFTNSAHAGVPLVMAHEPAGTSGFGSKITVVLTIVLPRYTDSTTTVRLLDFPALARTAWM